MKLHDQEEKPKRRAKWYVKWLSVAGIGTLAAVVIALPTLQSAAAYVYEVGHAPIDIQQIRDEEITALKNRAKALEDANEEQRMWRERTEQKLDNLMRMTERVLDNQDRERGLPPKQRN